MISKETGAKNYAASCAKELSDIYKQINALEPSPIRSENYLQQQLLVLYPLVFAFGLLLFWVLLGYRGKS
jgi:Ca-activated chloride channel family protein